MTIPKHRRIKPFSLVMDDAQVVFRKSKLTIFKQESSQSMIGVSVSKRCEKSACNRNKMKRIVKHSFLQASPKGNFVVIYKGNLQNLQHNLCMIDIWNHIKLNR